ncbi:hypothetical protein VNO80_08013 [Phaseolus coccineus]|uniref:Uncharacterized protein n=1 Tax=Phaseolus coccineus TaxID=3886 RepID=A0AAN9NKA7_PHACN
MDGPGLGVVKGGYDVWYTRLPRVETSILFDHCGGNSDGWTDQTIRGFSLEDFDAGWTFSSDVNLDWGAGKKGSRMQGAVLVQGEGSSRKGSWLQETSLVELVKFICCTLLESAHYPHIVVFLECGTELLCRKVEEHIRLNKSRGSVTGEAARAEAVGFTAEEAARAEAVGFTAGEAAGAKAVRFSTSEGGRTACGSYIMFWIEEVISEEGSEREQK